MIRILLPIAALSLCASSAIATTEKFRLIWNSSPDSSITVGWCQADGSRAEVHYRELGSIGASMTHGVDHKTRHLELESRFARLEDLKPDTAYEFFIKDSNSKSPRFTFKTAPAGEGRFSFVAGGDSRNHRDARQRANRVVSRLRPLFVCFGGDMISRPTSEEWADWLDDWQLTTGEDGHMVPIIAARGNHEGADDIHSFFDTPIPDDYYAVNFGNGFLRVYTLNTNIVRAGSQGKWLADDLAANEGSHWKVAHYHHPFRPHQSGKAEQHAQSNAWAPLFFEHGMDLAIECDSHVVKRTWPLRPSNEPGSQQGFIRDDSHGTTFIGEGCWGAPLRANDDDKKWTRASGSFNQVDWICVTPKMLTVRTIKVDGDASDTIVDPEEPFRLPEGMQIWEPESGPLVQLSPRAKGGRAVLDPATLARLKIVAEDPQFTLSTRVRIELEGEPGDGVEIRYTLDGGDPSREANLYSNPFDIDATTTVRAAIFRDGKALSETFEATISRKPAAALRKGQP